VKAILEFILPEEHSEYDLANEAVDWYCVVWDLDQWLRGLSKYENKETIGVDEVRDKIGEFMDDKGLKFE
jgi:hypothetical protein